ncbi:interferon-induced protein with tetratricopeptide repeats 5-like [Hypanus sabinus]|uniref:interferon-induced protein with tetratricopeptide repeats 5-like n=1 Tax=Hypanus sabinus TaxID=79690 RepID=UPI0028C4C88E|nr:interferon-induced protein with tetratricopeptide repeats 5-like [Hypanus sabinus]
MSFSDAVSNTQRDLLKEKLDQLQCHFTWGPQKGTIDLKDEMSRLQDARNLIGHFEEAIQNLKEADKILREDYKDRFKRISIITYGNFAWVHYHMGQLTEAQSYLDKLEMICKLLSDGPRYTAMIPEVYGEKGWSLMSSAAEYYEEAKECFSKALEQDPDNTEWIMGYATALSRLEAFSGTPESRDQSQSVKYFRRVLELDPDDTVAMVLLALKLQRLGQNEEANELVEQALLKTSDLPYVLCYAAKYYRPRGYVEKAIEPLKPALELTPQPCFLHHQLGLYNRNIESEYWWLSGEKHHFSVPRSGAMLRLLAKKRKSAIVGELNVRNTPGDLLKEKLDQLQCHFTWRPQKETIDFEDMLVRLEDSLTSSLKPTTAFYNQLAFAYCLQGHFEEAIEKLKKAEKILREEYQNEFERRSIITYGNFAWVHYHMGQLTKVQSYLDKLEMICKPLSDGPRYTAMIPEVYGEKGWSLLTFGSEFYKEAKECFAKALEQDPDNTEWTTGYSTASENI